MSLSHALTSETSTCSPASPPVRKGRPLLAWLVILAVVGFILYRYQSTDPREQERYDLLTVGFQGRYLVGLEQLEKKIQPASGGAGLYDQARQALNRHTYAQRLRFIVLAGELKGPQEACEQLHLLNDTWRENHLTPPEDEAGTADVH